MVVEGFVCQKEGFVISVLGDRESLKLMEDRGDVLPELSVGEKGCSVLNNLELKEGA